MGNIPHGAIRTVEEAEELISKAPVTIYRIDNYPDIRKREVRADCKISNVSLTYYHPSGFLDATGVDLTSKRTFIFTNYWHAWAYAQKLKQNRI